MPELIEVSGQSQYITDRDALDLMLKYYGQKFTAHDTARIVSSLSRADVIGLVKYAYESRQVGIDARKQFEAYRDAYKGK